MSSYISSGRIVEEGGTGRTGRIAFLEIKDRSSPARLLAEKAEQICGMEGLSYIALKPIQRLFLTHYRCPVCKLQPLYFLNLRYNNRPRCSRCGHMIQFHSTGKYGRLRKKIAFTLLPVLGEMMGNVS